MISIPRDLILRIIYTLKLLDVRGFDSMDSLVGIVNLLQSIVNKTDEKAADKKENEEA